MLIHPGGWTKLSTNFSSWRRHANSQVAWLHYDIAFKKDAATSGLAYWSRMNLDMYNFHTRASLPQTNLPSNAPLLTSRVVTSLSSFCWSWNDGTCHCHLANAVTTIAARIVQVSTLASTVLFCPWVSSCGQLPLFPLHQWHWYGSQIVPHYSMFQENFVHNVDIPRSIQSSNFGGSCVFYCSYINKTPLSSLFSLSSNLSSLFIFHHVLPAARSGLSF